MADLPRTVPACHRLILAMRTELAQHRAHRCPVGDTTDTTDTGPSLTDTLGRMGGTLDNAALMRLVDEQERTIVRLSAALAARQDVAA